MASPPNPGELLESQAMGAVVIETPPLTAVSDAFPLLRKVNGVVIVGQVGTAGATPLKRLFSPRQLQGLHGERGAVRRTSSVADQMAGRPQDSVARDGA